MPRLPRLSPQMAPYVFISPFLVLFVIFGLFPLLFSLYLAFQVWEPTNGLQSMEFVGFDNFVFAFEDEWFWKSLKNTGWLALASGVPQHLVAIPLAYFILTSTVAIAIMFSSLLSTDYGLITWACRPWGKFPVWAGWCRLRTSTGWVSPTTSSPPWP